MSLLNRRGFLTIWLTLTFSVGLAACGFQPVYGPGGAASALRERVLVQAPESIGPSTDVDAYYLVRQLETRLGRAQAPDFRLDLTLTTREMGQAITADGNITRYSLTGEVGYSLTRLSDGQVAASGEISNFSGYSASGTTVQTLASEKDAHQRLMVMLADQIVTRLYASPQLGGAAAQ
ncbi:LPS assembly lipoprotein LptE [Tritonibacter horizontis]|uniref:LPS-assembly lipoprotein LptE n=1 Tax=Tritonibacter horizontis TaxID=1768241 RepID=A0A132C4V7_9RHOB|nr:LPS assembly lipoprotein LptE [Tritonibacter horizontis]KUP95027.1 LPS-assembly lipoprotein LptE [Tritonibacter horizontis]